MSVQLKIKVTRKQIDGGCRLNGRYCGIALAARDIFRQAHVTASSIRPFYYDDDRYTEIPLPENAMRFIRDFDGTEYDKRPDLPELEFEITIPDEVIEKINIDELRPLLVNHPTLELI